MNLFRHLPRRKIIEQIPAVSRLVGQVCRVSMTLFEDNDTLVTANNGTNAIWYGAVTQREDAMLLIYTGK